MAKYRRKNRRKIYVLCLGLPPLLHYQVGKCLESTQHGRGMWQTERFMRKSEFRTYNEPFRKSGYPFFKYSSSILAFTTLAAAPGHFSHSVPISYYLLCSVYIMTPYIFVHTCQKIPFNIEGEFLLLLINSQLFITIHN